MNMCTLFVGNRKVFTILTSGKYFSAVKINKLNVSKCQVFIMIFRMVTGSTRVQIFSASECCQILKVLLASGLWNCTKPESRKPKNTRLRFRAKTWKIFMQVDNFVSTLMFRHRIYWTKQFVVVSFDLWWCKWLNFHPDPCWETIDASGHTKSSLSGLSPLISKCQTVFIYQFSPQTVI